MLEGVVTDAQNVMLVPIAAGFVDDEICVLVGVREERIVCCRPRELLAA